MVVFRWIQMFSVLIPMLRFTAVAVGNPRPFNVTVGVNVLLPCNNVTAARGGCDGITWTFSGLGKNVTLIGQSDADKLRVEDNCSLHIKTVRAEDAGQYRCAWLNKQGRGHGEDIVYDLKVFTNSAVFSLFSTRYVIVKSGSEATLSCGGVSGDQDRCDRTAWLFNAPRKLSVVTLFEKGQIHKDAVAKSDRLSVTPSCDLVIKTVGAEDVGSYICRQFKEGGSHDDVRSVLSVIYMTEHTDKKTLTLSCSVSTPEVCRHTVKWLYNNKDVNKDFETSWSLCAASVSFTLTTPDSYKSRYNCSCIVTELYNPRTYTFNFQPSPEKSGDGKETTTTRSTETTTASTFSGSSTKPNDWRWLYIAVAVAAAALIIMLAVIRWRRTKGEMKANKTQENDNDADPEDGVSYSSIRHTKKSSSNVRRKTDDDENAVTYATVKISCAGSSNLSTSVN